MVKRLVAQLLLAACLVSLIGCSASPRPANNNSGRSVLPFSTRPSKPLNSRETSKLVGLVVAVTDGDTITILDDKNTSYPIRLQGIDAPEKRQGFSNTSRRNLAGLVAGKQVTVEYQKLDRHKRIVGKVMVDGRDACLEQIKAGLAWHYKQFENEQSEADRRLYAEAEQMARVERLGLWQDPTSVPPWTFRHDKESREGNADTPTSSALAQTPRPVDSGPILGNKRTMIYHWPGCPHYEEISPRNRINFNSREEAEKAGYRPAKNCS